MALASNLNRRQFFSASAATALAGASTAARAGIPTPGSFGRAKSVVVLYLYGAPSQMDTLDPKPDAPA
jgi:hypothetical protein